MLNTKIKARDIVKKDIAEDERKIRTHNLCTIGGMVYKHFGDDISPAEFENMLVYLLKIDEVQRYVSRERHSRQARREAEISATKSEIEKNNPQNVSLEKSVHNQMRLVDESREEGLDEG